MISSLVAVAWTVAAPQDEWLPATVVGVGLVLFGGWLMSSHWKSWREHAHDDSLDDADRRYYRNQFRRRVQASGIILLLGFLIPIGDRIIPLNRDDASVATLYWLVVLALTCWVLLLAMLDLVATRAHSRLALSHLRRLREKQRELQAEADRLRTASGRLPSERDPDRR